MIIFEIYKDKKKEWRWRMKSRNNRIIADSAEGYKRKSACEKFPKKLNEQMLGIVIKYL
jgi:uncharacterized protein YegP (UPF0339 family)